MKKAALAVLLLGAALCIPGCGFEEGAGASVTVNIQYYYKLTFVQMQVQMLPGSQV